VSQSPNRFTQLARDDTYLRNFDALGAMIRRGRSFSGRERNCLFLNTRDNRFTDIAATAGFDFVDDGRAIGLVDWDSDGDLDIWLNNRTGPRVRFLENTLSRTPGTRFLSLRLQGTHANRDAIGARVEVSYRTTTGSLTKRIKTLRAGDSFLSQSSKWLHFGLGTAESLEQVVVLWPKAGNDPRQSATRQVLTSLQLDNRYVVVQPTKETAQSDVRDDAHVKLVPKRTTPQLVNEAESEKPSSSSDVTVEAEPSSRVFLTHRRRLRKNLTYRSRDGRIHQLKDHLERPLFVSLWASWCPNCVAELDDLTSSAAQLQDAGIQCVALCADGLATNDLPAQGADRTAGKTEPDESTLQLLTKIGWPFADGILTRDMATELTQLYHRVIYRQLPLTLPFGVLIDSDGRVAALYRGRTPVAQVLADAHVLNADPRQIAAAAFPFPGKTATTYFARNPLLIAVADLEAGYVEQPRRTLQNFIQKNARRPSRQLLDAFRMLGELASQDGQTGEAVSVYRSAVTAMPRRLTLQVALAKAYGDDGDQDAGVQTLQHIVQQGQDDWRLLNEVGLGFEYLGYLERAIAVYRSVLVEAPANSMVRTNLAAALQANNESADAIREYRHVLKEHPDALDAANNLALILANSSDAQLRDELEALRLARWVVTQDGGRQPTTLDTLAVSYFANNEQQKAIATLRKALELAKRRQQNVLLRKIETRLRQFELKTQ